MSYSLLLRRRNRPRTEPSKNVVPDSTKFPRDVVNDNTSIVFAHPEALLSKEGQELMASKVFQENVVACIVDEAHCVELC